jgi:ABC-type antimicrobial peptide transport system permease subunit
MQLPILNGISHPSVSLCVALPPQHPFENGLEHLMRPRIGLPQAQIFRLFALKCANSTNSSVATAALELGLLSALKIRFKHSIDHTSPAVVIALEEHIQTLLIFCMLALVVHTCFMQLLYKVGLLCIIVRE